MPAVDRGMIFHSLGTRDIEEARRRKRLRDVEWKACIEAQDAAPPPPSFRLESHPSGRMTSPGDRCERAEKGPAARQAPFRRSMAACQAKKPALTWAWVRPAICTVPPPDRNSTAALLPSVALPSV